MHSGPGRSGGAVLLYIRDGQIVRYVARRDARDEVEELMDAALGAGLEYEAPAAGRGVISRRVSAGTGR